MSEAENAPKRPAAVPPGAEPVGPPSDDASKYHLADLLTHENATALGSSPGEVRAALHGNNGPWTREQIVAAIDAYRTRPVPPL